MPQGGWPGHEPKTPPATLRLRQPTCGSVPRPGVPRPGHWRAQEAFWGRATHLGPSLCPPPGICHQPLSQSSWLSPGTQRALLLTTQARTPDPDAVPPQPACPCSPLPRLPVLAKSAGGSSHWPRFIVRSLPSTAVGVAGTWEPALCPRSSQAGLVPTSTPSRGGLEVPTVCQHTALRARGSTHRG